MFASPSWEKQIKPSVIAAKSDGGPKVLRFNGETWTVTEIKLCVDEAAAAVPSQVDPEESGGERNGVHLACRSLRFHFQTAGTLLSFSSKLRILVALLLLERRGSETASLACRPFDEVVETTFDQRLGQIALLGSSRLSAGSHGSHRARVEQWSTRVVLHLNHEWTSVFCSWLKATVSSSIVQDKMSCCCLNFHRCYWVMFVFMLLFFTFLFFGL